MDAIISLNPPMFARNAHHWYLFTIIWTFLPICKYSSSKHNLSV
jgi:hypothetical protein